jgi:peptidoglycan biosynthesis protein MviN/MurJ (putative lipid II flippase)
MYAIGLSAYSAVKVLVPACYAFGNTRLPVISSMLSVALTIALNLVMVRRFGFWGLALGTSVAAIFNAGFLLFAVRALLRPVLVSEAGNGGAFPLLPLVGVMLRQLVLALSMGVAAYLIHLSILAGFAKMGFQAELARYQIVALTAAVAGGGLWVWGWAAVFRVTETTEIFDLFYKKFKNKLLRRVG